MTTREPLEALYPFLHGGEHDARSLHAALVDSVLGKAHESCRVKQRFFEANGEAVVRVAHAIADCYRRDGRLFTMGNGGSSCDAAHIAVEFLHPITAGRPALAALNLDCDVATMTAVANDVGYAHVFVRPLIALARAGDALIGVSTSGNSPNLLAAFSKAQELGVVTIALAGMDGGAMARSTAVDHCLTVETDSVHRIQETHVAVYHILWDLVHTLLADTRGDLAPERCR